MMTTSCPLTEPVSHLREAMNGRLLTVVCLSVPPYSLYYTTVGFFFSFANRLLNHPLHFFSANLMNIFKPGPRKSIDELWDEVFEYKERIKMLERAHQQAQEHNSLQAQLDACNDYIARDDECQTPMAASVAASTTTSAGIGMMGTVTRVDKTVVYASRKGLRSEHGGAARSLLQLALGIGPSLPSDR